MTNYINPNPEQKIIVIKEAENLQQMECENLKLREEIAMLRETLKEITSIAAPYNES